MYPTRILVTLVALVVAGGGFVLAVLLSGKTDVNTIPFIVTMLGFIGLVIQNLVGVNKIKDSLDGMSDDIDARIRATVRKELEIVLRPILDETDDNSYG